MEKFINFKKLEVTGATKEEALEKAPFFIQGDATQAFKKWKASMTEGITEKDIKDFCINYLAKKSKNAPGVGFAVTIESAVANTRERPYRVENVKNEGGKRKYKTIYQLIDKKSNTVIAETEGTKADAKELARSLYTENGFAGDLICKYTKQVINGEPIAFTVKYVPSKNAKVGNYMVFGIEA